MWSTILVLFMSGTFMFPRCASAEPEVYVDYETYEVRGETAEQVRRAMNAQGILWKDGKTYDAFTSWDVSWSFELRQGRRGCYVESVHTVVKVSQRFPRWKDRFFAPPELQEKWNAYRKALREHEDGHKGIALRAAREIESSLAGLDASPSCRETSLRANALARQILQKHREQEEAYDETTRFGATQGAVFP